MLKAKLKVRKLKLEIDDRAAMRKTAEQIGEAMTKKIAAGVDHHTRQLVQSVEVRPKKARKRRAGAKPTTKPPKVQPEVLIVSPNGRRAKGSGGERRNAAVAAIQVAQGRDLSPNAEVGEIAEANVALVKGKLVEV